MHLDLAPGGVEGERAAGDRRTVDGARPPLQCPDPGDQLAEVERLDQVVVGAGVEPLDPIRRGVPRGEHQHRGRAVVACRPTTTTSSPLTRGIRQSTTATSYS